MMWIIAPLLMCFLLTGVHATLGFRVIARNIIFLDLALAQLASLGAVLGLMAGIPADSLLIYLSGMGMTTLGAVLFTFIPRHYRGVSQEVLIGLCYVISVATILIALHSSPTEAHHLQDMLVGNILFVSLAEVWHLGLYYGTLLGGYYGIRHLLHRRLPADSRWHDFVFYLVFGWVVTSSVKVAGVLLVFTFLIVPAVATLWTGIGDPFRRWLFALGVGVVFSCLGILASVWLDWPTGASLVVLAGVTLLGIRGVQVLVRG